MDETKQCPLCQLENNCGVQANNQSNGCWCALKEFPKEIFEVVPEEKMKKACICENCLEKFKSLAIMN